MNTSTSDRLFKFCIWGFMSCGFGSFCLILGGVLFGLVTPVQALLPLLPGLFFFFCAACLLIRESL